jgi:5,10-methylenetetrahydromethanopterin reductase
MEVSCAFPTALDSPDNIALAERLGYARAWVYDTPQQSPDVWMILALAAERTERIGLGPGVLVPSLRHPMVNAAATATLAALAPGRVAISFGTGFTGRRAMGYRAITWSYMESYIRAYRGLLRGEVVEWEGVQMQMLHPDGHAPARPVDVPILIAALGPKGNKVASELGDGLYVTLQLPEFMSQYSWVPYLAWGTVLDEGEALDSEHARAAGGPGWALAYHGAYEFGGPDAVRELPGGAGWMDVVDKTPQEKRHLAVHAGHCVALNEADQAA